MSGSLILYLSLEVLSLILFFAANKIKGKNKTASICLLIVSMLPFLVLNCFRAKTVGADYNMYEWAYKSAIKGSSYAYEWLGGFTYIFKIFGYVASYQVALAIINSITMILLFVSAYRQEKYPTLSLAILFAFCIHLQTLNQFRQTLALSLCLFNIENARKQKIGKYIFVQILATISHASAIIFLPIYILAKKKLDKKMLALYIALCLITLVASTTIMNILSSTSYGQRYLGGKYDVSMESSVAVLAVRAILLAFVLIMRRFSTPESRGKTAILYHMAIICTLMQLLAVKSYIFARLTTYYYIAYVLLIPEAISSTKITKRQKQLLLIVVIAALLVYKIVYYQKMGPGAGIDNYKFIWEAQI